MTKQVGRSSSFCRAVHARRHRPVGRRRHGLRPRHAQRRAEASAISAICSRSPKFEAGGSGEDLQARLLDRLQRRPRPGSRQPAPRPPAMCRICSPASRPRATPSTAAMRAASMPPRSPPSPTGSTRRRRPLRRHHHLPGAALRPGDAQGAADAEPRDAGQGGRGAGQGRAQRHRDQRARHHLQRSCCRRWPRPARRSASPATACTAQRRCTSWRICRNCRRCSI